VLIIPMRVLSGRRKVAIEKQLVSVRYCPDVNYCFRASGADWQARMNAVRKEYVEAHSTGNAWRA
jgi:uncharacterized protein (DUF4415 family)